MQLDRTLPVEGPLMTNGLTTSHPHSKHRTTHIHNQTRPLHQPTTPAIMATQLHQRSTRKRKRNKDDAPGPAAAPPLHRSRRIAHRTIFRFNDLAPELRNEIYMMAMRVAVEGSLYLIGKLPATVKSLSQVSRTVRSEALSLYYPENTFRVTRRSGELVSSLRKGSLNIEKWVGLFGSFAAPHIRSLCIRSVLEPHCYAPLFIDFMEPIRPLTVEGVSLRLNSPDFIAELNAFTLAVLRPEGDVVRSTETLRLLLTGLRIARDSRVFKSFHNAERASLDPLTPFGICYWQPQTALAPTIKGRPCLTAAALLNLLKSNIKLLGEARKR